MKRIIDLIMLDVISLQAKKISIAKVFIAITVLALVLGMISPIFLYFMLISVTISASLALIDLSDKNEGEMTYAVIPATRKQIVIARYSLILLVLTIIGSLSLIIMMVRYATGCSIFLDDELSEVLNLKINDKGIFTVILCLLYAWALIFNANALSGFFKKGKKGANSSSLKTVLMLFIAYMILSVVLILETSLLDVKLLHSALQVIITLFTSLSVPYNGALLCIFTIVGAYGFVFYKMACSVIDYEEREL